ncbi:TuaD [Paenibacillus mucilaginosus KNP414]|uniref:UDP-glucose 6-dehydrogenase n=1 Tax=Paenibacillus mucilaginosus (strain KNP414) TaxID=1036673 RepID=F8FCC5_PAEMK|nr:TuaD [Paenibacillus mucilaginosus KNP414]
MDKIKAKIDSLNRGEVPIYEPGIEELIEKNTKEGRLSFSDNLTEPVENSEIIIIAVGTPPLPNGEADLQYVDQVARDIALAMNGYKIVMTKSTVPVGTNERIKGIISELTAHPFDVVSVPEFLREGSAIKDTLNPDRIIIGSDSPKAQEQITRLHQPLTDNIIITDIRSAEMIKYASNAFLATKISFINEIANICEKVGADVTKVAVGMGYDKRIGSSFLQAGIGYGGSCFPKDTGALIQIAGNVNYEFKLLKAVVDVNTDQRFNVIAKLKESLGDLKDRTIGIWGLAFKPNTDDIRDAPAIDIVEALVAAGARIRVYDPIAMPNFKRVVQHASIEWCDEPYEVATGCDAVCLLTEWDEFKNVDLIQAEALMKQPILIDGRNVFSKEQIEKTNFSYYSVGRPSMTRHYREPVNN